MPRGKSPRSQRGSLVSRFMARHLETLLSVPGSRLYRRFVAATRDTRSTQEAVLREILRQAGDTVFGREHRFGAIDTPEQYRAAVPVRDYEGLYPYIERHMRGEAGVLFPGKPLMYNQSSGTTAKAKLLPISPYAFERTIKNRGKLWLYGLMRDFPGVYAGKDFTLVSPAVEGHTPDGTPYGSLSGVVYQNIPEFIKLVHTIPYSAMTIADHPAKVYTLLRCALGQDVTIILTGNPSTVLNLVSRADQAKAALIRDIHDGTLDPGLEIEPAIRAEVESTLAPDPGRAAELERIAARAERFSPAHYWPRLRLVHTWTNGNCALLVPKLKEWFAPGTPILDFGYIASELTATDLIDKETGGSILQIRNGYYEFTHLDEGEAPDRRFYRADELEVGQRYLIYITTLSGLYRYDMNDVLEVVGHFNSAPIVRFLFKGKGITSITGEKLSEAQLIEAMSIASRRSGVGYEFFMGYADTERQRYCLYVEFAAGTAPARRRDFQQAVDQALGEVNVEYRAKRKSERLSPLEVVPLGGGAFERYRALRLAEGAHDGQFKWMHLSGLDHARVRMDQLVEGPCSRKAS
ncbi:MAG: GH3 auxin-responsive promoter family protein [Deltaproteobacteria bacterium]|nr:GH3 auxin-responsive promoter family protein [Deltaproteobacteria bacterium]